MGQNFGYGVTYGMTMIFWILLRIFLIYSVLSATTNLSALAFRENSNTTPAVSRLDKSESVSEMHPSTRDVILVIGNQTKALRLTKNLDLLAPSYKEVYYENGKRVVGTSSILSKDFCYYNGIVDGDRKSHAAVNLCNGKISGTVYYEGLRYDVLSNSTSAVLYLIPASAHEEPSHGNHSSCGHTASEHGQRVKRASQIPPYYKKYIDWKDLYVEMAIVFDNSVYRTSGGDKTRLFKRAKELANFVNSFYQPVNIKVALVGVEIWSESDRITVTENGDTTLDQFLRYRRVNLLTDMPNDHAQLITSVAFGGGVVGKAMKGPICSSELSGAVVMDHSRYPATVAATMAHELGHNFGMEHDGDNCQCPQPKCLMAASSSSASNMYWSSCSMEYLAWTLSHGGDFCLKNKPSRFFDPKSPVCGNGFVEDGEQCDCGLADVCDNPCCNASTCQLAQGASCASGACCDTSKCQVKAMATTCRESRGECDLAEYCDGKSEICPNDTYTQNGISCSNGQAYCYDGKCNSHESQCKLIWGPTGDKGASECYTSLNTRGDAQGSCGYKKLENKYTPCGDADVMCGSLQCSQKTERPQYGDKSLVRTAYTEIRYSSKVLVCHTASIDLGSEENDPGLVPSGAQCGKDKMCRGRKCLSVKDIQAETPCETTCRNGVCNNLGHCHCLVGYGGRDCGSVGLGGSIDSGPASLGGTGFNIGLGVLIFLVVVLPLVSALLTYLYKKGKIRSPKIVKIFVKSNSRKNSRTTGPRPPATKPTSSTAKATPTKPTNAATRQPTTPKSTTLSAPNWPLPLHSTVANTSSASFPKPTINVNLNDGLVPVLQAIVSSTTALNTNTTSTGPSVSTISYPIRPKRPDDDSLAKLHQIDETLTPEFDPDEEDVILPRRPAPPPPPTATNEDKSNKRKISKENPLSANLLRKTAEENQIAKSQSPSQSSKVLLPPLPFSKPKLIQQEDPIQKNEVSYTMPEKKPKPILPPAKPTFAKAPAEDLSNTYYDVIHSKADSPSKGQEVKEETKIQKILAPPKVPSIPKEPLIAKKPSLPSGVNGKDEKSAKPQINSTPEKPILKSAFVADLEKKLKAETTLGAVAPSKKALVPPPAVAQKKENALNQKPAIAKKNSNGKDDNGLVSAMAARFEKS